MNQGPAAAPPPTQRQRHYLGRELAKLRSLAGLSGRALASATGLSQSGVSRVENGQTAPTLPQVRAWIAATDAPDTVAQHLLQLTEAAHTEVDPWRTAFANATQLQDHVRELEAQARTLRLFEPSVVPGLLQSADYARRVFELSDSTGKADHAASVAGRLRRQEALYQPDRHFQFILTESALRWQPASVTTQLAQLDRLASIATLPNITLGLLPFDSPALGLAPHGFVLYDDLAEGTAFVRAELAHAELTVSESDDVAIYRELITQLAAGAVYDAGAREVIERVAAEFRTRS